MQVFHLALESAWRSALEAGEYTVSTLGLDLADVGFIHCSQAEQVVGVHERFYDGVSEELLLLTIDTDLLTSPWQLDDVPGQPLPFPHGYGPVNVDAVVSAEPFRAPASS
ncbi:MAG: DUF952 domain-containing protein [Aeromicrobium sp.]